MKDQFLQSTQSVKSKINFCFLSISLKNTTKIQKDEHVIMLVVNSTINNSGKDCARNYMLDSRLLLLLDINNILLSLVLTNK